MNILPVCLRIFFYSFAFSYELITNAKLFFLLRQAIILFIFFAFTFSTIDELVKLCFDKIECFQELTDLDDSESDDLEKDVDLDKIFHTTTHFLFQAIFVIPELSFLPNHAQNYFKQVIYAIVSPPPEV
jgi:hypothetical protein